MVCVKICLISSVMVFIFLSTMMIGSSKLYNIFLESLDNNQQKVLTKIVDERRQIYHKSLAIGVVLSLLLLLGVKPQNYSGINQICLFTISLILIMTLVYTIHPKSDQMIKHIKTDEQKQKWINLKNDIKFKKIIGILVGYLFWMNQRELNGPLHRCLRVAPVFGYRIVDQWHRSFQE